MQVESSQSLNIVISGIPSLGVVACTLEDLGSHRGRISVTCSGTTWCCTWNSTGCSTLAEFVSHLDAPYLAAALAPTMPQRQYDETLMVAYAKTLVIQRRRALSPDYDSLDQVQARQLYNACDDLLGYREFQRLPPDLIKALFGEQWHDVGHHGLKVHPDFLHLCQVAQAVIDGLANMRSSHPARNRYGLDQAYFGRRLNRFLRDMSDYPPEDAARELARMARTADAAVLMEAEFAVCRYHTSNWRCLGAGYLVDDRHHDQAQAQASGKPCPACNTQHWLSEVKNQIVTMTAAGATSDAIEQVWLEALAVAYRVKPAGLAEALEAVGAIEIHRAKGDKGFTDPLRYNAPEAAAEADLDERAVESFAVMMLLKLAKSRAKGRGGWHRKDECDGGALSHLLREHVDKGDPIDVGLFSMMLQERGEAIAPELAECEAE